MTKKVLVITDAQNEFITGALGNKECEAAVKNIVAAAKSGEYYKVIITKDTHTADYLDTQEGKRLPVLHGQEGTEGYKIHPDIVKAVQEHYAPENVFTVKKPTFGSPEFGKLLNHLGRGDGSRRGSRGGISHGSGLYRILYRNLCVKQCSHGKGICTGSKSMCYRERLCLCDSADPPDGDCCHGTDPGGCHLENISYLHSCESKRERG